MIQSIQATNYAIYVKSLVDGNVVAIILSGVAKKTAILYILS